MSSAVLVRLRPTGPWRIGPDSGDRDRVDRVYHSDALYAAVCGAMFRLGEGDAWLDSTARAHENGAEPAVRFSSCFPFHASTLFVVPPQNVWPPAATSKVRWKGARFVPLSVVETLLAGKLLKEDAFAIDGPSECLVSSSAQVSPFRTAVRSRAAVDRAGESVAPHSSACLEFSPGAGLWFVGVFADHAARERWRKPLEAALRWLADSGFGGERSLGWGRSEMPEIVDGSLASLLWRSRENNALDTDPAYWLLSLFHPAADESVDWQKGQYSLTTRGGRVESAAGWGEQKKLTRMVTEGSVLVAASEPRGTAPNVAPEQFPHPVYRAGFALCVPIRRVPVVIQGVTQSVTPSVSKIVDPVVIPVAAPVVEPVVERVVAPSVAPKTAPETSPDVAPDAAPDALGSASENVVRTEP